MRKAFLLVLMMYLGFSASSQTLITQKPEKNLVPNGSFENFRRKNKNSPIYIYIWQERLSIV